ncbi:MAG: NifU family protein [Hyphomonadaceae bacterium]|jgi:Fe-S cluster biogenesis protein NfuA|nr:NifU family protein [Hyphomonadaceae bacterium]MBP9233905.1 NifU family protein [Hyphomonadaceae bacterium]
MFIQTQPTPNPATLKFLPGCDVSPATPYEFISPDEASASPLASALFIVNGVKTVFLGNDFVAITKTDDADWAVLKPQALAAIMDHFVSGAPVIADVAKAEAPAVEDDIAYEGETAEIVAEIKELIATRVRPAVANDGGDIIFKRFDVDTGIVHLTMRGACSGCPSSTLTLKQGVENLLRHYVPEVTAVEAAA